MSDDTVNHPAHYTSHPSGVECIQITEHMGFNLGNALKYIWRADLKGDALEDLRKAAWYIEREIAKRTPPKIPFCMTHLRELDEPEHERNEYGGAPTSGGSIRQSSERPTAASPTVSTICCFRAR